MAQETVGSIRGNIGNIGQVTYEGREGKAKLKFSVASNSGKGEAKETTWYNCTLWEAQTELGTQLESLRDQLKNMPSGKKTMRVIVFGKITTGREYTKDDGSKALSNDVSVWDVGVILSTEFDLKVVGGGDEEDEPYEDFTAGPKASNSTFDGNNRIYNGSPEDEKVPF